LYVLTHGAFGLIDRGGRQIPLSFEAPMNMAALRASPLWSRANFSRNFFRTSDLLLVPRPDTLHDIYVAHHVFAGDCAEYRISAGVLRIGEGKAVLEAPGWRTLWTAKPCVPFFPDFSRAFGGHQSGGRIALLQEDTLVLSVGDHDLIQHAKHFNAPRDPAYDHGKIIEVNRRTGEARHIAKGFRNPQGLLVDAAKRVWTTGHAMFGGDELNLIQEGRDYGWPLVTLGVNYNYKDWPHNPNRQGRHDGFEKPKYAWAPSIGISQLIEVTGPEFDRWEGDLLVASLKEQTLYRLRRDGDAVILAEPIPLALGRLRDLLLLPDGAIAALTDSGSILIIRNADRPVRPSGAANLLLAAARAPAAGGAHVSGAELFQVRCSTCHSLSGEDGAGPSLQGVVGREVASRGFAYSEALGKLSGRWSEQRLAAFLEDPGKLAPGGAMADPGLSTEQAKAVAAYLAEL
jgi:cytochrome c2